MICPTFKMIAEHEVAVRQMPKTTQGQVGPTACLTYDFGIAETTPVNTIIAHFTFLNTCSTPVTIIALRPSCGCTSALAEAMRKLPVTLLGQATVRITVTIDASHLTAGSIEKSVSIYAANHKDPIGILHIIGTILPPVKFSSSSLDFGTASRVKSSPLSLIYDDSLEADGSSVALLSRDTGLTIDPAGPAQPAPGLPSWDPDAGHTRHLHTFTVHLNPGQNIGNLTGRLVAVRRSPDGPDIELGDIPYYANVQGDIHAQPTVIAYGMITPGKPAVQIVKLQGKDLEGATASSANPNLSVKLGPVHFDSANHRPFGAPPLAQDPPHDPNHESVDATVALDPSAPSGPIQTSVSIKTTSGQILTLPVYALVSESQK